MQQKQPVLGKARVRAGAIQQQGVECYVLLKGQNLAVGAAVVIDAGNMKKWAGTIISVAVRPKLDDLAVAAVTYDKNGPKPGNQQLVNQVLCVVSIDGVRFNGVDLDIYPD